MGGGAGWLISWVRPGMSPKLENGSKISFVKFWRSLGTQRKLSIQFLVNCSHLRPYTSLPR